jgi:hypothetical protein
MAVLYYNTELQLVPLAPVYPSQSNCKSIDTCPSDMYTNARASHSCAVDREFVPIIYRSQYRFLGHSRAVVHMDSLAQIQRHVLATYVLMIALY